jgi:hypothetical protein
MGGGDVFWKLNVSPCHHSLVVGISIVLSQFTLPESFQQFCKLWIIVESMFVIKNDDSSQDTLKELM